MWCGGVWCGVGIERKRKGREGKGRKCSYMHSSDRFN